MLRSRSLLLRELGAHLGQGYFYGRPMKLDELIAWTSTHAIRPAAVGD
jgi:EAL domain-containing protein (putative c-di-GMP-specific phosphodiesterase class I)